MSAMNLLLESTVKTSIIVLIALSAAALLRRQSAAVRHWILASAILCAALTPVLGSVIPSWPVPINVASAQWLGSSYERSPTQRTAGFKADRNPLSRSDSQPPGYRFGRSEDAPLQRLVTAVRASSQAIAALWIAGAAISFLLLCVGLGRLTWIAAHARGVVDGPWAAASAQLARDYGLRRRVRLLQTDHPSLLVTWGLVQPRIILPRSARHWSTDRIRVVLAHELAHVRRRDWAIQMLAEIVRAVYWFNPLVWRACARLRQESEHATDDAVLSGGMTGSDYAGQLVDLARALNDPRRHTWLPAAAVARPSSLERRVRAMLNDRTNRAPATRPARIATVAAVSCLTVALAAAQGAFATFSGTVFDETNGFIPGATLVLTNAQSRAKYEVISDPTGHFEFVGLPPGDYQLETQVMGFATLRGTLTLTGQNAQRDLVLKIGSLQETITIIGPGTRPWPERTPESRRGTRRPDPICNSLPTGGMGGNIRAPHKLVDVKPHYPQQLYEANIGGTVVLQALIDTEGRVSSVEVEAPAHPDLNAAAIEAVRQWEFDSTILNCTKVEVPMKVNVNFVVR